MRVCRKCAELPAFFIDERTFATNGHQRDVASIRAGTPSGDITKVPEGGEEHCVENERTPGGDGIGPGRDSVGGYY